MKHDERDEESEQWFRVETIGRDGKRRRQWKVEQEGQSVDDIQIYDVTSCSSCHSLHVWFLVHFTGWNMITKWGDGVLLLSEDELVVINGGGGQFCCL